ncbi:MAG: hypothetical protein WBY94_08900 [Polyangiaceae bacterium]
MSRSPRYVLFLFFDSAFVTDFRAVEPFDLRNHRQGPRRHGAILPAPPSGDADAND